MHDFNRTLLANVPTKDELFITFFHLVKTFQALELHVFPLKTTPLSPTFSSGCHIGSFRSNIDFSPTIFSPLLVYCRVRAWEGESGVSLSSPGFMADCTVWLMDFTASVVAFESLEAAIYYFYSIWAVGVKVLALFWSFVKKGRYPP